MTTTTDAQGNLHSTDDGKFAQKQSARPSGSLGAVPASLLDGGLVTADGDTFGIEYEFLGESHEGDYDPQSDTPLLRMTVKSGSSSAAGEGAPDEDQQFSWCTNIDARTDRRVIQDLAVQQRRWLDGLIGDEEVYEGELGIILKGFADAMDGAGIERALSLIADRQEALPEFVFEGGRGTHAATLDDAREEVAGDLNNEQDIRAVWERYGDGRGSFSDWRDFRLQERKAGLRLIAFEPKAGR